jgi:predicted transcriptional regulator
MEMMGPLQARVMDFVWSRPGTTTVAEVFGALNASKDHANLAYTTILTVMRTLANRGYLWQLKLDRGRRHIFTAKMTRDEAGAQLAQYVVATYFRGELDALVKAYSGVVAKAKK